MPLPTLYVSPEDKIDSKDLAKELAAEIVKSGSMAVSQGAGPTASAGATPTAEVHIEGEESNDLGAESIRLQGEQLDALHTIAEKITAADKRLTNIDKWTYSSHFDDLSQRKNKNNHAILERIAEGVNADPVEKVEESDADPEDAVKVEVIGGEDKNDVGDALKDTSEQDDAKPGKDTPVEKNKKGMMAGVGKMLKGITDFLKKIGKMFMVALLVFGAFAAMIGGAGEGIFRQLREGFDLLIEMLAPMLELVAGVIGALMTVFMGISNALMPIITKLFNTVLPPLMLVMSTVVDAFMMIVDMLMPIINQIMDAILPVLTPALELIAALLNVVMGVVVDMLTPVLAVLGHVVAAFASAIGFVASVLMAAVEMFTEGPAHAAMMLQNAGDFIVAGIGDMINGIIEFVAGIVDNIPIIGPGLGDKLREQKVDFADDARARIQDRNASKDGSKAAELEQSGGIDFDQSSQEFADNVAQLQADGEIDAVVAKQLIDRHAELEAGATAAAETPAKEGGNDMIDMGDIVSDSLAAQKETNEVAAEKLEAELQQGRGSFVANGELVDGAPGTPAGPIQDAGGQLSEAQDDAAEGRSGGGGVNVSTTSSSSQQTIVNSKSSTGIISTGASSLGHRHRRVLPGVA